AYGACPGPPHGHCALMVEIAGKTPAITESAATSFAPVTSCRIFLDGPPLQSKTTRPSLDVLIPPRRAHYGRKRTIREDRKVYLARLFGDFSRSKRAAHISWWCLAFAACRRAQAIGKAAHQTEIILFRYVVFPTHRALFTGASW